MRRAIIFLALCLSPSMLCAQTQSEMNAESCGELKKADAELNRVYHEIMEQHKGDGHFLVKFKASQRAWLVFRDAEVDAVFPEEDKQFQYGSVFPMCNCDLLARITQQRVEQLSEWLNVEEGDVCAGSHWQ